MLFVVFFYDLCDPYEHRAKNTTNLATKMATISLTDVGGFGHIELSEDRTSLGFRWTK